MSVIAAAPDRTTAQRFDALRKANDVRIARALLKVEIKQRRRHVLDVLIAPPSSAETMKVIDLLLAAPKIGRVKAERTLRRIGISPSKTIAGLSERQRRELAALLGALYYERVPPTEMVAGAVITTRNREDV